MADYLLDWLDMGSPYLPRALTGPLYTILNQLPASPSELFENPSSIVPLAITLFSAYFAFRQFLGTLKWGVRTGLTLLKLGIVASLVTAVWTGYENVGTERGVLGGVRDVYDRAEKVGRGVYQIGKRGTSWYLGNSFSTGGDPARTRSNRRRRTTRPAKSTNSKKRMWEDPEEIDLGKDEAEDFVKSALDKARGVWGLFNSDPSSVSSSESTKAERKRNKRGNDDIRGGGGGFVWNMLANQAKKVWDEAVDSMEPPGAKTTTKRTARG